MSDSDSDSEELLLCGCNLGNSCWLNKFEYGRTVLVICRAVERIQARARGMQGRRRASERAAGLFLARLTAEQLAREEEAERVRIAEEVRRHKEHAVQQKRAADEVRARVQLLAGARGAGRRRMCAMPGRCAIACDGRGTLCS